MRSLPYRTTEDTNNVKTTWKILLPLLGQLLDGWQDSFIMRTSLIKVLQGFRDTNPPPRPTYQITKILRCIYFFTFYHLEVGTITEVSYSGKKKKKKGGVFISSSQGCLVSVYREKAMVCFMGIVHFLLPFL